MATRRAIGGKHDEGYEGGKVARNLEAVVRIAKSFNAAVAYPVIPDAARRPLHSPANALGDQLADFATLKIGN